MQRGECMQSEETVWMERGGCMHCVWASAVFRFTHVIILVVSVSSL